MKDVMLDIETLGTDPGCVITQIGAVPFDRVTGAMGEPFLANIEIGSAQNIGLEINAETLYWWFSQKKEAQTFVKDPSDIFTVFHALSDWVSELASKVQDLHVWSHTFDTKVLAYAYKLADIKYPFSYRGERDLRTLCDLAGTTRKEIGKVMDETEGEKHDAFYDCKVQIKYAVAALNRIEVQF